MEKYLITDFEKILLKELKNYFGTDQKRIAHAKKVLAFAKQIMEKEKVINKYFKTKTGINLAKKNYLTNL